MSRDPKNVRRQWGQAQRYKSHITSALEFIAESSEDNTTHADLLSGVSKLTSLGRLREIQFDDFNAD